MTTKEIKKDSYVWGHVGVIIYHVVLASLLIISQFYYKLFGISSRILVLILAFILLITSLLALIPILKIDEDKIVIQDN